MNIGTANATSVSIGRSGQTTTVNGTLTSAADNITSATATALTVAASGTNYGLQVNESTTSAVTGLEITSAASGSGLALAEIGGGTNENLTLNAKGSGTVTINGTATGAVSISHGLTVSGGTISLNATGGNNTNIATGSSTGAVSIGNSSAGTVALNSGTGITLTSSGNITDDAAATISIGATNATSVSIGRATKTTTVNGALTSSQLLTGSLGLTVIGAATSLSGGNIAINNLAGSFTTQINAGTSTGAISIGNTAAGALTLTAGAASTWSTSGASSALTITSGATTASAFTLNSAAQASGATGGIAIATGNATSGTAGNIALDVGSSSTSNGQINIGTARLETINIGTGAFADAITIGSTTGGGVNIIGSGSDCVIGSGAGPTNCTSDARLKQNVVDLGGDTLAKVLALRPVDYNWNTISGFDQTQTHIGLIAQEVQQQFPDLVGTVYTDPTLGNVLGVDYQSLVVPAIKAIQQQQAMLGTYTMTGDDLSALVATIQIEAPRDPVAAIADNINNGIQFLTNLVVARVTAIQGYFYETHQTKLCIGDPNGGGETCITKAQLDQLLSNQESQNNANVPTTPAPISATPSVAPTIPTDTNTPAPVATTPDTNTPTSTDANTNTPAPVATTPDTNTNTPTDTNTPAPVATTPAPAVTTPPVASTASTTSPDSSTAAPATTSDVSTPAPTAAPDTTDTSTAADSTPAPTTASTITSSTSTDTTTTTP